MTSEAQLVILIAREIRHACSDERVLVLEEYIDSAIDILDLVREYGRDTSDVEDRDDTAPEGRVS